MPENNEASEYLLKVYEHDENTGLHDLSTEELEIGYDDCLTTEPFKSHLLSK